MLHENLQLVGNTHKVQKICYTLSNSVIVSDNRRGPAHKRFDTAYHNSDVCTYNESITT